MPVSTPPENLPNLLVTDCTPKPEDRIGECPFSNTSILPVLESNLDIDWRELYPIMRWRQTGGDYPEENREGNLES
jgi:hypothetical protein